MPNTPSEYASILDFARTHNNLTYVEFDHYTKNEVNLFAIRENFDFDALEDAIDRISAALPAIKRIFAHPIIRLKDSDAILPVESVRVVNSKTVTHTAVHSEFGITSQATGLSRARSSPSSTPTTTQFTKTSFLQEPLTRPDHLSAKISASCVICCLPVMI